MNNIVVTEVLKDGRQRKICINTAYIMTVKEEINPDFSHNTTIYTTNVRFPLFILESFEEVIGKIHG